MPPAKRHKTQPHARPAPAPRRAPARTGPPPLPSLLPSEIIPTVCDILFANDLCADLARLMRVNKELHDVAARRLYRSITINEDNIHGITLGLNADICQGLPERPSKGYRTSATKCRRKLASLSSIVELTIETPDKKHALFSWAGRCIAAEILRSLRAVNVRTSDKTGTYSIRAEKPDPTRKGLRVCCAVRDAKGDLSTTPPGRQSLVAHLSSERPTACWGNLFRSDGSFFDLTIEKCQAGPWSQLAISIPEQIFDNGDLSLEHAPNFMQAVTNLCQLQPDGHSKIKLYRDVALSASATAPHIAWSAVENASGHHLSPLESESSLSEPSVVFEIMNGSAAFECEQCGTCIRTVEDGRRQDGVGVLARYYIPKDTPTSVTS